MHRDNRKRIAGILAFTMMLSGISGIGSVKISVYAADSNYGLANPRVEIQTRQCIEFGSYWQEDTNGDGVADTKDDKTPIEWQILKQDGDDLLLLSDKILDCQRFNESTANWKDAIWETCDLRKWLNGKFYSAAFSEKEQAAVKTSTVMTDGAETSDKLFLLSLSEAQNTEYEFQGNGKFYDQARKAEATDYAINADCNTDCDKCGDWWLRTKGDNSYGYCENYVSYNGVISTSGRDFLSYTTGVRPAIHVNAKDAVISSALSHKTEKRVAQVKAEWDTVEFGTYNEEKIRWRVLSVDGDDAYLLSDKILAAKAYNTAGVATPNNDGLPQVDYSCSWATSTLRSWLNEEFYNTAFTKEEQSSIKLVKLKNEDNYYKKTDGGDDTEDHIYLLSLYDAYNEEYGFPNASGCESAARKAAYADGTGYGCWWLRTPGTLRTLATYIFADGDDENSTYIDDGYIDNTGHQVERIYRNNTKIQIGVRPVLHLNLASSVWTKGEVITCVDRTGVTTGVLSGDESGKENVTGMANTAALYVVSFNTDGGSLVSSQKVASEEKAGKPDAPVKDGYTFEGWYMDSTFNKLFDFEAGITADTTIYAKWKVKEVQSAKPDPDEKDTNKIAGEGSILTVASGKYTVKVVSSDVKKPTVLYYRPASRKSNTVKIPETVTCNGITYTVIGVADNAFKNNKTITKVTINSKTIGRNAFAGCKKLKTIIVGKKVERIENNAFANCKKLKTINIKSTKLTTKTLSKKAFKGIGKKTIIKIPKKMKKKYTELFRKKGLSKKVKIKY